MTVEMKSIQSHRLCEICPYLSKAMQDLSTTEDLHTAAFRGLSRVWASPRSAPWPWPRRWWRGKPRKLCRQCLLAPAWAGRNLVLQLTWFHLPMWTAGRDANHQSRAGKAAVRVRSTLFSEPISSLKGALQADIGWLFRCILHLSNAIPPVAPHHARCVGEWRTVWAS